MINTFEGLPKESGVEHNKSRAENEFRRKYEALNSATRVGIRELLSSLLSEGDPRVTTLKEAYDVAKQRLNDKREKGINETTPFDAQNERDQRENRLQWIMTDDNDLIGSSLTVGEAIKIADKADGKL